MPDPIPELDISPPTPHETARAEAALALALASHLAAETVDGPRLTWTGLLAFAALGAMLDVVVDELIVQGHGDALLSGLADVPSRAFAVIHLLDDRPDLAARLLAPLVVR